MKSSGNGSPNTCMTNLLRITRSEVRFDILRGMLAEVIDMPATMAISKLRAEAYWLISNYEPRITFGGLNLESLTEAGVASLNVTS